MVVPCPRCHGTGHIPLSAPYAETLALLQKQHDWISVKLLAGLMGVERTAMNNRMMRMEKLGLVRGRKATGAAGVGGMKLWRAMK